MSKYKKSLERLRAQDTQELSSNRVPAGESTATPSRYGKREIAPSEMVRQKRFIELDIVTRSEGHIVAQKTMIRTFQPTSILLFGSHDCVLESMMIGTNPILSSPLSASLFETPMLDGEGSLVDRLSSVRGPAHEILETLMLLRGQDFPPASPGQTIRAVFTGRVEHVILWGSALE